MYAISVHRAGQHEVHVGGSEWPGSRSLLATISVWSWCGANTQFTYSTTCIRSALGYLKPEQFQAQFRVK